MTSSKLVLQSHLYQYRVPSISKLTGNVIGVLGPEVTLTNILHNGLEQIPDNVNQPGHRWDSNAIAKSLELAKAERKRKEPTLISTLIDTSDPKLTSKRQRLTRDQKGILEAQYFKSCNWDNDLVDDLAKQLDIKSYKVYKWNWDRR